MVVKTMFTGHSRTSCMLRVANGDAPEPKEGLEKSPLKFSATGVLASSNGTPDNGLGYRSNVQPVTVSDLRSRQE